MTPPVMAATTRTLRPPLAPRRVSGPARRYRPVAPARPAPLAQRVARRAAAVPDARFLDRLIRGRAWIGLVGVMLMGLVFLQVSLLQLNTGIGRAVQSAATLERANQDLRTRNATLDATERVQQVAQDLGMVMPAAGQVRYLRAGAATPAAAAAGLSAPAPVLQQSTVPAPVPQATPAVGAPAAAPVATTATGPAVQPPAPTQTAAPAQTTAPTQATAPAQTATTTAAPAQPVAQPAPTQAPVTQPTGTGGAAPTG